MKQINVKLLAILFLLSISMMVGTVLLYKFQKSRKANTLLKRAEAAIGDEEFVEASGLLQRYLRVKPNDNAQYVKLANCRREVVKQAFASGTLNAKIYNQAYSDTETALRKNPDNKELRRAAVEFAMQFDRYSDAISHLDRLLDGSVPLEPDEKTELRHMRAQCHALANQDDKAIEELSELTGYDRVERTFDKAKAQAPNYLQAYRLLAAISSARNRDDETSAIILNQMVELNPEMHEAYLLRAQFFSALSGKQDIIRSDIERALELAPDDPTTILFAAEFFKSLQDFDRAEELFLLCRSKFPDNIGVYHGLSSIAIFRREYDEAAALLDQGLERDPKNNQLLWSRVSLELDRRQLDRVADTRKLLEEINYPRPYLQYLDARIAMANQQWAKAAIAFDEVRPQIAQYRPAWLRALDGALTLCYEKTGQHDLRLNAFQRIIDSHPDDLQARWGKVQALLAMKQLDRATDEYEVIESQIRSREGTASGPMMRMLLQMELVQQERLPEEQRNYSEAKTLAQEVYERKLYRDPQTASVLKAYFIAIGKPENGERIMQSLAKSDPNNLTVFLNEIQTTANEKGVNAAMEKLDERGPDFENQVAIRVTRCELLARIDEAKCRKELEALESDLEDIPAAKRPIVIRGIGRVYMLLNDFDQTSRLWERLAEDKPQDIQIRLAMFELALQREDEEAMRKSMKRIEELLGKESAEWKWCRAVQIVWEVSADKAPQSDLENAQGLIAEAIAQREGWDALFRLKGKLHELRNQPQAAIDALEKSLRLSVGNPTVYRSLARLYYAEGRMELAERMLNQTPPSFWEQPEQRMKMEMMTAKGELPENLPYDKTSTNPADHEWVGKLMANASQFDKAEEAFLRAKALGPNRPSIWNSLARMYQAAGKPEKINELLDESDSALGEVDRRIFRGEALAMLEQWDQAIEQLEAARDADPENVAIQRLLADTYERGGRRDEAVKIIDSLIENAKPNDPAAPADVRWARLAKAQILGNLASYLDYRNALKLIQANGIVNNQDGSVRLGPQEMIVWGKLAIQRPDGLSQKEAIDKLLECKNHRELSNLELRLLADLYRKQGRWSECKSVMQDLLLENPKDMQLLDPWLNWLLENDELQAAARYVKSCPPNSMTAIRTLSELDVRQGRADRAVKRLNAIIPKQIQPKDATLLRLIGAIYEQLAKSDKSMSKRAETVLRRYIQIRPDDTFVLAGFLGRRGEPGDLKEAVQICSDQIKAGKIQAGFDTIVAVFRSNRATIGPDMESTVNQIRALFDKVQNSPDFYPSLLIQRSQFEDVMGDSKATERYLTEYMSLPNVSPNQQAIVANNLAYLLALQGESEKSDKYIKTAVRVLGPTADLRDTIGMVYYAQGQYKKAIVEFEAALADGGATAFKYVHLAMGHLANSDAQEAARAMKRAIELGLDPREMTQLEKKSFNEFVKELKKTPYFSEADMAGIKQASVSPARRENRFPSVPSMIVQVALSHASSSY